MPIPLLDHGFKFLDIRPVVSYSHSHANFVVSVVIGEDDVVTLGLKLLMLRDKNLFFKQDLVTINVDHLCQNWFGLILDFEHNSLVDDGILLVFNV